MAVAGVDIGSVATKAVVLVDGQVVARRVVRTGVNPAQVGEETLRQALQEAGLTRQGLRCVVTTGYGRRSARLGPQVVTEITAGGRGAWALPTPWGRARTVVDLGGQDSKVILLDEAGAVVDFAMNDRCAAGTGRFLEVMAGVLGVALEEMGARSLEAAAPVTINSTCTVFAESEVVSLIAQGCSPADIAAGLHAAIGSRLAGMVRRLAGRRVMLVGGGALNRGVQRALEEALGEEVYVPPEPQFVVALGAALIAAERSSPASPHDLP